MYSLEKIEGRIDQYKGISQKDDKEYIEKIEKLTKIEKHENILEMKDLYNWKLYNNKLK